MISFRHSNVERWKPVADIKDASKAVEHAIGTYDRELVFKSGLLD